jgi:anti-anti-sigma factor
LTKLSSAVTAISGAVSNAGAEALDERLKALIEGNADCVFLDFDRVTAFDAAGVEALARASRSLLALGRRLLLVRASPVVAMALDRAGLAALLPPLLVGLAG